MIQYHVFYGNQLYGQYSILDMPCKWDLPDGVYIYDSARKDWFVTDLSSVLISDVPKHLLLLKLILNL